MKHSKEKASSHTLLDLSEEMSGLEKDLEIMSVQIGRLGERSADLVDVTSASAGSQTSMSILKMLGVVIVSIGQVYLITGHFAGAQSKRRQIDPFG